MTVLFLSMLAACGGEEPADEKEKTGPATLVVTSPEDGATFEHGVAVPLSVSATREGQDVDVTRVTWTIGDWTANGAEAEARDLDAGTYTVAVEAVVDGETLTGSVGIEVLPPEDTGPTEPVAYAGSMQTTVMVHTADYGDFDDACNGPVAFTVQPDGTLAGQGNCTAFDQDFVFAMEGQVRDGVTQGQLILTYDNQDYGTPWDGTGDVGGPLTANFDKTHSAGRDSIRIYGNWSASPQ